MKTSHLRWQNGVDHTIGDVDPLLFGDFAEHLGPDNLANSGITIGVDEVTGEPLEYPAFELGPPPGFLEGPNQDPSYTWWYRDPRLRHSRHAMLRLPEWARGLDKRDVTLEGAE